MTFLKGQFLVATPDLLDPNFARTVVFMVEHNSDGAFGLVLTRPHESTSVWDICEKIFDPLIIDLPDRELLESHALHIGGPVQTASVFFLHTDGEIGDNPIAGGAYIGNQADDLAEILRALRDKSPAPKLRVFLGYAGWGPGQLEKELDAGGWLSRPSTLEDVFSEAPTKLWRRQIRHFDGEVGIFGLMPDRPDLN